jgi:isoleucyl-tRNA synthetase
MATYDVPSAARLSEIEASDLQARVSALLEARAATFAAFEQWKVENDVTDSHDVSVTISTDAGTRAMLNSFGEDLANLFKFSSVTVYEGTDGPVFVKSEYEKCERSRLRRKDVEQVDGHWLTRRDRLAIGL